jgi:GrpB-like predicted nucleotidyltransferase (UPF0157 family)
VAGTSPVELVPYSAGWPQAFGVVARRLRGALEAGALRVDHVGSTSVPGLLSKDRLDIGSLDLDAIAKVGSAGFELVPELRTGQGSDLRSGYGGRRGMGGSKWLESLTPHRGGRHCR